MNSVFVLFCLSFVSSFLTMRLFVPVLTVRFIELSLSSITVRGRAPKLCWYHLGLDFFHQKVKEDTMDQP